MSNFVKKLSNYMKSSLVGLCLTLGLVGLESKLYARDIHVPRDYQTIQAAIDANDTVNGDRILVAPGVYDVNEPITYRGKNIILKSENRAKDTIINGKSQTRIFVFNSGETNEAVLEGFTITKGKTYYGGGIYCQGSSPIIRYNIIVENETDGGGSGGGIACLKANPLIMSNIISGNVGFSEGGGIYCEDSQAMILDNIIKENSVWGESGGGIQSRGVSPVIIKGNYVIGNIAAEQGGGVSCVPLGYGDPREMKSRALIENNIIAKNKSDEYGCGIVSTKYVDIIGNTIVGNSAGYASGGVLGQEGNLLLNNIIWSNTPTDLSGIQPSQVFYSNISQEGFAGTNGNISVDPLFVNPNPDPNTLNNLIETGDFEGAMTYLRECYSLQPNSPCIDSGDPDYFDPDGTRSDIGAIYFDKRNIDLYRDDILNFRDYAIFANTWLTTGEGILGDVYKDNKVDYKDLKILADNWLWHYED